MRAAQKELDPAVRIASAMGEPTAAPDGAARRAEEPRGERLVAAAVPVEQAAAVAAGQVTARPRQRVQLAQLPLVLRVPEPVVAAVRALPEQPGPAELPAEVETGVARPAQQGGLARRGEPEPAETRADREPVAAGSAFEEPDGPPSAPPQVQPGLRAPPEAPPR